MLRTAPEILPQMDAEVAALGRSGRSGGRGWVEVARSYPRGLAAFRRDWNAYRESQPAGVATGARAHVVAAAIDEDVRPALDALSGAGVVIHEVSARAMSNGRMFLDVAEVSAPLTPLPWLLPGRPALDPAAPGMLPVGTRRAARAAREAADAAPAHDPPPHAEPSRAEPTPEAQVRCWLDGVLARATGANAMQSLSVLNASSNFNTGIPTGAHEATRFPFARLLHAPFTALGSADPVLDAELVTHAVTNRVAGHLWAGTSPSAGEREHLLEFCLTIGGRR